MTRTLVEIDGSRRSGSGAIVRQALDAHVADRIIPFAAMATGNTVVRIPCRTEHIESGAWLAGEFLGAEVTVSDGVLAERGVGFAPE